MFMKQHVYFPKCCVRCMTSLQFSLTTVLIKFIACAVSQTQKYKFDNNTKCKIHVSMTRTLKKIN